MVASFRALRPVAELPVEVEHRSRGAAQGATGDQEMNATTTARPPQAARPLTDDPTLEAQSVRGLMVALLIAVPFWLLIAALTLAVV
jgi:hypothetical protein